MIFKGNLDTIGYFIADSGPLLPNNMPLFWDIWNNRKKDVFKEGIDPESNQGEGAGGYIVNLNNSTSLYESASFEGMIPWVKNSSYTARSTWSKNVVLEAPDMWQAYVDQLEEIFPWYECEAVILWAAVKPVLYHIDLIPLYKQPMAIRSLIYDTNPNPTFKIKHRETGLEKYVPYTKERNSFAFNNASFYHGADYDPNYYKILMRSFGKVHNMDLFRKQIAQSIGKKLAWGISHPDGIPQQYLDP